MKVLWNVVFVISLIQSILQINSSSIPSAATVSSFISESSLKNDHENESYQSTTYPENDFKNEFDNYNQEGMKYESNPQEVIYVL
jgi:hypothetical protein